MGIFLYNKLWLVMVISTACVVTSAEPKPTQKSRVVDRVCIMHSASQFSSLLKCVIIVLVSTVILS